MNYTYDDFKDDYCPEEDYIDREDELAFAYTLGNAFKGGAEHQYIMGYVYSTAGHGVKVDLHKAEFWFLKAAQGGNITAQCELGKLYSEGRLCPPDYKKALNYFLRSAEQGNYYAQTQAGIFLYEGKGAERDFYKAAFWLERGAKGGYAEAYYTLARIYAADKAKYEEYLKKALGFNFGKAYADLCAFYLSEGRRQEAKEVYTKARKWGNKEVVKSFDGEFEE